MTIKKCLLSLVVALLSFNAFSSGNWDHYVAVSLKAEPFYDWVEVDISIDGEYAYTHRAVGTTANMYVFPIEEVNLLRKQKVVVEKLRYKPVSMDAVYEFPLSQHPLCSIKSDGFVEINNPSRTAIYVDYQGCFDVIVLAMNPQQE